MKAHLFICTNVKADGESCGAKLSGQLKDAVKKGCHLKCGKSRDYRVNASGCLGRCEEGIVAVMYPETHWWTNLKITDSEQLISAVERAMKK